jgi:hypothetical protein
LESLRQRLSSLVLLLLDELSLVGGRTFVRADRHLRLVFPERAHLPFAGVHVMLFGDFDQLQPVLDDPGRSVVQVEPECKNL